MMDDSVQNRDQALNISEVDRDVLGMAEKVLQRLGLQAKDFQTALTQSRSLHSSGAPGHLNAFNDPNTSLLTPPGNSPRSVLTPYQSYGGYSRSQAMSDIQSPGNMVLDADVPSTRYPNEPDNGQHHMDVTGPFQQGFMVQDAYLTPGDFHTPQHQHTQDVISSGRTLPSYPAQDSPTSYRSLAASQLDNYQPSVDSGLAALPFRNHDYQEVYAEDATNQHNEYEGAMVPMEVATHHYPPCNISRPLLPRSLPRGKQVDNTTKITKTSKSVSKRRGRFKDAARKRETAETRKDKACPRCWIQKLRCNPVDPINPDAECHHCERVRPHLPCVRWKLPSAELLDKAAHPRSTWTLRFKSNKKVEEIDLWASNETRTITITQGIEGSYYKVTVGQFVAIQGDQLFRKLRINGAEHEYFCPPFAITDMQSTLTVISNFVDTNMEKYIDHYTQPSVDHFPGLSNRLVKMTYLIAHQYCAYDASPLGQRERSLLRDALRLWVACRMENRRERITDLEALGITSETFNDQYCNNDYNYISPVMAAQIEIITMVAILDPKKKAVLRGLNDLIRGNKNKSDTWFTIYLTMFILLHSCGLLVKAERERNLREPRPGSQSRYFNPEIVSELHKGANNLLYYFHYFNQGSHAFDRDWSAPRPKQFSSLNDQQVQFMKDTAEEVERLKPYFARIRANDEYENEYYFVAQLYDPTWQPKGPKI